MSSKKRKRFTKAERRKYANRDHPEEEVETLSKIIQIDSIDGWKPVEGIEDFIKNCHPSKPKSKFPCRVIMPDDEPYGLGRDSRFIGGSYPQIYIGEE